MRIQTNRAAGTLAGSVILSAALGIDMKKKTGRPLDSRKVIGGDDILLNRTHFLLRRVKQAHKLCGLVSDGDRILVGLSGGKDSLTLLRLMQEWRRIAPELFEMAALHVEYSGGSDNDRRRELLIEQTQALGVPIDFMSIDIPKQPKSKGRGYLCFLCSRRRRKELFAYAAANGFSKVALAHHLDDAVETALMNLFFHAGLETMEPKKAFFDGAVTLIRPLILAEEREIVRISSLIPFPYFECPCSEGRSTERKRAREIIRSFGRLSRMVKRNIWQATRSWPGTKKK